MKIQKILSLLIVVVLLMLSLTACFGPSDEYNPGEALSRDPDTWSDQDKKEINDFMEWLDEN